MKLQPNPPSNTGLLMIAAAIIGAAAFAFWPKKAAAAPAPTPAPQPQPVSPNCIVHGPLLNAWASERGFNVLYIYFTTSPIAWDWETLTANFPEILSVVSSPNNLIVVTESDNSFWVFTGTPPVLAPAPAQKLDYCAWLAQHVNS